MFLIRQSRQESFILTDKNMQPELSNIYNTRWNISKIRLWNFLIFLTISVPEKLKKLVFEIPIIPQTLNINNQRTTSSKAINLDIVRNLIEYSFKKVLLKARYNCTVFEILLFEGRLVLSHIQRGIESARVKISVKNRKTIWLFLKLLEKWLAYKVRRFWIVFIFFDLT